MRSTITPLIIIFLFFSPFTQAQNISSEKPKDKWLAIDSLMDLGLIKTAKPLIKEIYDQAKENSEIPDYIKSLVYLIKVDEHNDDFDINKIVEKLKNEIDKSQTPQKQILYSVLAETLFKYCANKSYEVLERTPLLSDGIQDINTWDGSKLEKECLKYFEKSIENKDQLVDFKIKNLQGLISEECNICFTPSTLYDFLTLRVIHYIPRIISAKQIDTEYVENLNLFSPVGEFVELEIESSEVNDLWILKLYQSLLREHLGSENKSFLIQIDIDRVQFVRRNLLKSDKYKADYINALEEISNTYPDDPEVGIAKYIMAKVFAEDGMKYNPFHDSELQWDIKKAVEVCHEILNKFPESKAALKSAMMLDKLNSKSATVFIQEAQLPNNPILASIEYRNCDTIFFRIIKQSFKKEINRERYYNNNKRIDSYIKQNPIEEWFQAIPDLGDFQEHTVQVRFPELKEGNYILLSASSKNFDRENVLSTTDFHCSNMSMINRSDGYEGQDLFVLDRNSGFPVTNVKLDVYLEDFEINNKRHKLYKTTTYFSDKNGFIHLPEFSSKYDCQLVFSKNNDTLLSRISQRFYYGTNSTVIEVDKEVAIYTDRKIYRPGQKVYFKGIVYEWDDLYCNVVQNHKTTVEFFDVNNKLISSRQIVSNEFGSFHGSVIIPENSLNGTMKIKAGRGVIYIDVEEYKRPNFEISFDSLKTQYRFNDLVKISGTIKSFSGVLIDNSTVEYYVYRTMFSIPDASHLRKNNSGDLLTSSRILTNDKGVFEIDFHAEPGEFFDYGFNYYTIEVVITDVNGETQSAYKVLPISNQSLWIKASVDENIEKNTLESLPVEVINTYGYKQNANISASIYKVSTPDKAFKERKRNRPDQFVMDKETFYTYFPNEEYDNENDREAWEIESQVFQSEINTKESEGFIIRDLSSWESGYYKAIFKTIDHFDEEVELIKYFTLYSTNDKKLAIPDYCWINYNDKNLYAGDTLSIMFGTSAKDVSVLYEIKHEGLVIFSKKYLLNKEQKNFLIPLSQSHVGNVKVDFIFIKDNECFQEEINTWVKDPNRELKIRLTTFRKFLKPVTKETWIVNISGTQKNNDAELLCSLTDASVDKIKRNIWKSNFDDEYLLYEYWYKDDGFDLSAVSVNNMMYWGYRFDDLPINYNTGFSFPSLIKSRYEYMFRVINDMVVTAQATGKEEEFPSFQVDSDAEIGNNKFLGKKPKNVNEEHSFQNNKIRKNFNETAFFYPDLKTDKNGNVEIKFTSPEALSRWKFMALAHTKDLRTAYLEKEIVTQKELMLTPNIPRFFRQGDTMFFSTRISNLTDKRIKGETQLKFYDPVSMKEISNIILDGEKKSFEADPKSNISKSWKIVIPDNINALTYRLTATSKNNTDGEERMIPVLSNRMLITESFPIHIDAKMKKDFSFTELLKADSSQTLKHHRLKLEMCSNPNWYAIQALPHIAKTQKENSIALFNRYYANSMASYILNSSPRIKSVFEQWKNIEPDAFLSELEKNQELKSVLLAETPWLLEAQNENERKRRLGLFFDLNTMKNELESSLKKLMKMQRYDGSWSWYDGGRSSRYITQHILSGLLKLKHRGVISSEDWKLLDSNMNQAIKYLNSELRNDFNRLKEREKVILDDDHLTNSQIQYLYALSFAENLPGLDEEMEKIMAYYLDQEQKYWMNKSNLLQAMIAITLHRKGDTETSRLIIQSLKERASLNDEMGMYWKQTGGYFWYQFSIETQAFLIEAFSEISNDKNSVKEMKKWLLKQKQTQMWSTAKSSVEAVNALLLDGSEALGSSELIVVKLDHKITPSVKVETGTGYYELKWSGEEIKSAMGNISVHNLNKSIAWGALHWQYFENLDKIKSYETPLKIEKQLFKKELHNIEIILVPLTADSPIKIGDKIVSRIIIRVDRDMEFVHLKDMRAAAFEPRNVFSRYRYQNGLFYYESTKDAASHFYFDELRKGTYVFEYEMFAIQKGTFSNGITNIQCMYAPEFASHSEGIKLTVIN